MLNKYVYLYIEDDVLSRDITEKLMRRVLNIKHLHVMDMSHNYLEHVLALDPRPTFVLLDIHMHPFSGFQVLTHLRQREEFQDAIIVALTASVTNDDMRMLQEAGFDGVIAKPLSIMTFPALLERISRGEAIWHIM
jgi:two-component system cell cycle response regulator DivK